jgi:hypothetical protein
MPERDQIILDTFAKVFSLVDEAFRAMNSDDKTSFHLLLWRSAAEAEYLAFQVSMVHGLSDLVPNVHSSYDDSGKAIEAVRVLLAEAQPLVHSDPRRAYQSVRSAATILRKTYASSERSPKRS